MSVSAIVGCNYGEDLITNVNLAQFSAAQVQAMTFAARVYTDDTYATLLFSGTTSVLTSAPSGAPASWSGPGVQITWSSANTSQTPATYYWSLARTDSGAHTVFSEGPFVIASPKAV